MHKKFSEILLNKLHADGRDIAVFLLSLLLAFGIWLVHNLTMRYSTIMNVTVVAESNIEGRSNLSSNSEVISARCRASGFRILKNNLHSEDEVRVYLMPEEFTRGEGDMFTISANSLASYVSEIFGEEVQLESFVTRTAVFHFAPENFKIVPVMPRLVATYKPQYMAAEEMRFEPDSVVIYGDPNYIGNIDRVLTDPLELKMLKNDVHGEIGLEIPSGVRASEEKVNYSMQVTRFVEVRTEAVVEVRNLPAGKNLTVIPSKADVVLKCVFPLSSDPSRIVNIYIDYNEFANSITGRCVPRTDDLPSSVIDCTIAPQVFDCVEQK